MAIPAAVLKGATRGAAALVAASWGRHSPGEELLRVLIVSNTYPPADISGVGALVYELALALGARGERVRVLTRRAPEGDPYAVGTGGKKLLFPLLAAFAYWRLERRERFELVHIHESDGVFVVLLLRLLRLLGLTRAKLVSTLQVSYRRERWSVRPIRVAGQTLSRPTFDEYVFAYLRAPLHAFLGRLTVLLSDGLVAPSQVTAGELAADYGARDVRVIANGVRFADVQRRAGERPAERPPTVLYVGRLRTRKAVAVLLAAWQEVLRQLPTAKLVIVGDGEQMPALRKQAAAIQAAVPGSVELRGGLARAALLPLYAEADVYCLPSLYEGFPVAILEAMAAGLPVVSTTVSGIPEAVLSGETGLLVPPADPAALASALLDLLRDPERARRYGDAGFALLTERFTIEKITQAYLALWSELGAESADQR